MRRAVLCFVVLGLFGVQPAVAQDAEEAQEAALVYEAFYAISFSDLDEWNSRYWEYSVPVLQALVDEGVIEGWDQYQHQTGGAGYNIRFAVRAFDWAAYDTFWSEYFSRLREAVPDDEWNDWGRIVTSHRDEIWDIQAVSFGEDEDYTHMYASKFQVNFADMAEWNGIWEETMAPILSEGMSEGILTGWVKLGHSTGGSYNSKVLFFHDGWDTIDDLLGKLLGTVAEQHPEVWARINELILSHDDAIWAPTTRDGM